MRTVIGSPILSLDESRIVARWGRDVEAPDGRLVFGFPLGDPWKDVEAQFARVWIVCLANRGPCQIWKVDTDDENILQRLIVGPIRSADDDSEAFRRVLAHRSMVGRTGLVDVEELRYWGRLR